MKQFYFFVLLFSFFSCGLFAQVKVAPTVQATDVTLSNFGQTQVDIAWTRGDGDSCVVFAFQGMLGMPSPSDGSTYNANTVFGSGSETTTGSGWFCVYNGTGTSVTMTGLVANTHYLVHVFEYNGAAGSEEYLSTGASNFGYFYTLPSVFNVTGGGVYCEGVNPTGINVTLSGSQTGVSYQLLKGGVAEGNPLNGTGSSLEWSDLYAGVYTVEAFNNTDTVDMTDTAEIIQYSMPVASFTGLLPGYCVNADTAVLVPNPSGGIFSGTGVTSEYFIPAEAGSGNFVISYMYTDSNNCSVTIDSAVSVFALPVINLDSSYSACDTLLILDAGAGFETYLWSNGDTTQTTTVTENNTFSVIVSDVNGCVNNDSASVTLSTVNLVVADTVNSCTGANVTLTASGTAGLFIWNATDSTASITVNPTTEQYYFVTLQAGQCSANDSVLVIPHDYPVVTLPSTITECGVYTLNPGSGNGTYNWTGGVHTSTLTVTSSGTYNVTVTNTYGCSETGSSVVTILPAPNVNLGADITIALNQTIILGTSAGYDTYLWSTGATGNSIAITGSDLGVGDHDIWLTAGLSNGCDDSDTITIHVTWASGINENNAEAIMVYPNPSNENIFITTEDGMSPEEISVFSMLGQKVINVKQTGKINVEDLPSGMYTMIIRLSNGSSLQRNIIVK